MRSGLGPAPEPGRRRDSHAPTGVIARADSRKSSMCVQTLAKCPAARVATQPPSVENSNDCGKWRSVRPCSPSAASSAGPVAPAPIRAERETGSTSSRPSSAARSIEIAPFWPGPTSGVTPPTTDVPPPYGIAAMFSAEHHSSRRSTSASSRGCATKSGGLLEAAAKAADDIQI